MNTPRHARVLVGSFFASFLLVLSPLISFAQTAAASSGTSSWSDLGATQPVVTGAKANVAIASSPNATVYLAYSDKTAPNSPVNVKVYDSGTDTWQSVGSSFSKEPYNGLSMIVTNSEIYVANTEYLGGGAASGKLAVYRYALPISETGQWTLLPTAGLPDTTKYNSTACLARDSAGQLYVAGTTQIGKFSPGAKNNQPYVYSLASGATQWTALATTGLPPGNVDSFSLRIAPNNTPYLAYRINLYNVQVQAYSSSQWTLLTPQGDLDYVQHTVNNELINIDSAGNLYAVTQRVQDGKAVISKYTGTARTWTVVGDPFAGSPDVAGFAVDAPTALYAFYRTRAAGLQPEVKSYASGTDQWSVVGTAPIATVGPANSMRLVVQSGVGPVFGYTTFDTNSMTHSIYLKKGSQPSPTPAAH